MDKRFAVKAGQEAPRAVQAEATKQAPSLDEIAALTETTYSAARFAPRDYDDLRAQATDAYDSGDLRKDYYPPKRVKEKRRDDGYDWRDVKYTAEELSAWRHRSILRLMRVARLGAALGYLPEVSWENIYVFDGQTMVGCHMMKGSILALKSCVEWTDEEIIEKNEKGVEFVIGYKMTVRRMLPSGNVQKTVVQCYKSEFAHLFEGKYPKEVWLLYGADMIYAACVRRAANHAFPDRVRGMGTKEEFAVMRHASTRRADSTPAHSPTLEALLEEIADDSPLDMPTSDGAPLPSSVLEQEVNAVAQARDRKAALLTAIKSANDATTAEEIGKLRVAVLSYPENHQAQLRAAWAANELLGAFEVSQ